MTIFRRTAWIVTPAIRGLDYAQPLIDLGVRLWVANVFWKSGMAALRDWQSTLDLFIYRVHVPFVSAHFAAGLATGVELIFPVLLALGLGGRFSAGILLIFNILVAISYPGLTEAGLKDHIYWGILLAFTLLHGPGRISIDNFIRRRWMK
ncbi:MAG: DoxX family protein [Sulfuricaulis sp.]